VSKTDAQRIAELERSIAEATADLDFIYKNVKDKTDRDEQARHVIVKINILKGQLATYKKERLPDLSPNNPNSGASGAIDKEKAQKTKDEVEKRTHKKLSDQQLDLYLKTKRRVLGELARLPGSGGKSYLRKLEAEGLDITNPDSFSDKMFLDLVRQSYNQYYKVMRDQIDKLSGKPITALEETGSYMRIEFDPALKKSINKKVEVPGLKLIKRPVVSNQISDNPAYKGPRLPQVQTDPYVSPVQPGFTPELWPLLIDGDPDQIR
jgi:hypothetical protein